jgi:hypothetical protein
MNSDILSRLQRLERSNRRLKAALGAVAVCGVVGMLCAAGPNGKFEQDGRGDAE